MRAWPYSIVIVCVLALSSCTDDPGVGPGGPSLDSSTAPAITSVGNSLADQATGGGIAAGLIDELWEWSVVAGPSPALVPPAVFDGEVLVFSVSEPIGEVVYRSVSGGGATPLTDADVRTSVGTIAMGEERIAALLAKPQEEKYEIHIWETDGTPSWIIEGPLSDVSPWGFAFSDGTLLLSETVDGASCLTARGGRNDRLVLHCEDDGLVIDRVAGTAGYASYVAYDPRGCGNLVGLSMNDGAVTRWPSSECALHSGIATSHMAVWEDQPQPDAEGTADYFNSPIWGAEADKEPVSLGRGLAGSVSMCSGTAYWKSTNDDALDEIRMWRPGQPVSVIYRSPDLSSGIAYATTRPVCVGGNLLIQRASSDVGAPDELLVSPPVEWTVNVPTSVVAVADPEALVSELRTRSELAAWAAPLSDQQLITFAEQACAEIAAVSDESRVAYIWDIQTENEWAGRMSMQRSTLWIWRQVTTLHMCPEFHQLTLGDG